MTKTRYFQRSVRGFMYMQSMVSNTYYNQRTLIPKLYLKIDEGDNTIENLNYLLDVLKLDYKFLRLILHVKKFEKKTVEILNKKISEIGNFYDQMIVSWELNVYARNIEPEEFKDIKKKDMEINIFFDKNEDEIETYLKKIESLNVKNVTPVYTLGDPRLNKISDLIKKSVKFNFKNTDINFYWRNASLPEKFAKDFFKLYSNCLKERIIVGGFWKSKIYEYFERSRYNLKQTPFFVLKDSNVFCPKIYKALIKKIKNTAPKLKLVSYPQFDMDFLTYEELKLSKNNKKFALLLYKAFYANNDKTIKPNLIDRFQPKEHKKPMTNMIAWSAIKYCNYNCSYCYLDNGLKEQKNSPTFDNFNILKRELAKLEGDWSIYLLGGEPFQKEGFFKVVDGLLSINFLICISTNLSADTNVYLRYIDKVKHNIGFLQTSFHPENVRLDEFLQKALTINNYLSKYNKKTTVAAVSTKDNIFFLQRFFKFFRKLGLNTFLQTQKIKHKYRNHTLIQLSILNDFEIFFGPLPNNLKGVKCPAGKSYFAINFNGEVFRCSGFSVDKKGWLGNILDGTFKLHKNDEKCPFDKCADTTILYKIHFANPKKKPKSK